MEVVPGTAESTTIKASVPVDLTGKSEKQTKKKVKPTIIIKCDKYYETNKCCVRQRS